MRTLRGIESINTEALDVEVKKNLIGLMIGRINTEVEKRIESDKEAGNTPKHPEREYAPLMQLKDDKLFAEYCVAFKLNPRVLINSYYMSDAELAKHGLTRGARQRNVKAVAKHIELARFVMTGTVQSEHVFYTFLACMLQASRFGTLPRTLVKNFIGNASAGVSNQAVLDAIEKFRDNTRSGGVDTQTSQNTLTAVLHGMVNVQADGRTKTYKLNAESPVVEAVRKRLGMVESAQV